MATVNFFTSKQVRFGRFISEVFSELHLVAHLILWDLLTVLWCFFVSLFAWLLEYLLLVILRIFIGGSHYIFLSKVSPIYSLMTFLVVGILCALGAFVVALVMVQGSHFTNIHSWFGIVVLCLSIFTPSVGWASHLVYNPSRSSPPIWPDRIHCNFRHCQFFLTKKRVEWSIDCSSIVHHYFFGTQTIWSKYWNRRSFLGRSLFSFNYLFCFGFIQVFFGDEFSVKFRWSNRGDGSHGEKTSLLSKH